MCGAKFASISLSACCVQVTSIHATYLTHVGCPGHLGLGRQVGHALRVPLVVVGGEAVEGIGRQLGTVAVNCGGEGGDMRCLNPSCLFRRQ